MMKHWTIIRALLWRTHFGWNENVIVIESDTYYRKILEPLIVCMQDKRFF